MNAYQIALCCFAALAFGVGPWWTGVAFLALAALDWSDNPEEDDPEEV